MVVKISNAFNCWINPTTWTGNSPTGIGTGPSLVIILLTSTTTSLGKLVIAPLFSVSTTWISPLSLYNEEIKLQAASL